MHSHTRTCTPYHCTLSGFSLSLSLYSRLVATVMSVPRHRQAPLSPPFPTGRSSTSYGQRRRSQQVSLARHRCILYPAVHHGPWPRWPWDRGQKGIQDKGTAAINSRRHPVGADEPHQRPPCMRERDCFLAGLISWRPRLRLMLFSSLTPWSRELVSLVRTHGISKRFAVQGET